LINSVLNNSVSFLGLYFLERHKTLLINTLRLLVEVIFERGFVLKYRYSLT